MLRRKETLKYLILLLILVLPTLFTVNVYIYKTEFQKDKCRALVLYHNMSSTLKYNIKFNEGLEFAIKRELENLGLKCEILRFETSRSHLNKTFLDSFDLIVIGGIYYWWKFCSNEDKIALYQTSTPILASVHYGIGPKATLINKITGVWSEKIEVLPCNATLIYFTSNSQKTIGGLQYLFDRRAFNFWLINASATDSAKVLVYGIREGKRYPLVVFNGTKNILINEFTYMRNEDYYELWEWPKLLLLSLDYLFDILSDNILRLKLFPESKPIILFFRLFRNGFWLVINMHMMLLLYIVCVFFAFLIYYQPVEIKYVKRFRFQVKIHTNSLRKVIFRMLQVSLILMIVMFYMFSFTPDNTSLIWDILCQITLAVSVLTIFQYILSSQRRNRRTLKS